MLTGLLGKLDHCNTPSGIQETIAMVTEVANLDDDFKVVYMLIDVRTYIRSVM